MRCSFASAVALLALSLLPAGSGCAGLRPPAVRVAEVTIADRTDEAVRVDFALDLVNPNEDALELVEFQYQLAIGRRRVYEGRRAALATLGGRRERRLTIPTVVPFAEVAAPPGAAPADLSYSLRGRLLYVAPGEIAEILYDMGMRKPTVSFAAEGTLVGPVPPLPAPAGTGAE